MVIAYTRTNESLQAIVSGLEAQAGDRIYAICGSGDQAFALLEWADSVVTIDDKSYQVDFINRRANLLRRGSFEEFLEPGPIGAFDCNYFGRQSPKFAEFNLQRRNTYFREPCRLDRIRQKIPDLTVIEGDVLAKAPELEGITKVYLSNPYWVSADEAYKCLSALAVILPQGGLIYIALRAQPVAHNQLPLELDQNLTNLAGHYEAESSAEFGESMWLPEVYKNPITPSAPIYLYSS